MCRGYPSPRAGRVGLGTVGPGACRAGSAAGSRHHRTVCVGGASLAPQSRLRACWAWGPWGGVWLCSAQDLSLLGCVPPGQAPAASQPLATSHLCVRFWGSSSLSGTWIRPGRCPQPSHGLCCSGVLQPLPIPEPWRVEQAQPRTAGVLVLGLFLGLSLLPATGSIPWDAAHQTLHTEDGEGGFLEEEAGPG